MDGNDSESDQIMHTPDLLRIKVGLLLKYEFNLELDVKTSNFALTRTLGPSTESDYD